MEGTPRAEEEGGSEAQAEPRPRGEARASPSRQAQFSPARRRGAAGPVTLLPRLPAAVLRPLLGSAPGGARAGGAGGSWAAGSGRRRRFPPWSRLCAGLLRARRGGWAVAAPLAGVGGSGAGGQARPLLSAACRPGGQGRRPGAEGEGVGNPDPVPGGGCGRCAPGLAKAAALRPGPRRVAEAGGNRPGAGGGD